MKSVKELREYFAKADYQELQKLLDKIFRVEVVANVEWPLYLREIEELRTFLKKMLDWTEEDGKRTQEIAQDYKGQIEKLRKEKGPLLKAVTTNEKRSIFKKIMESKITKAGLIAGAGAVTGFVVAKKISKKFKKKSADK